MSQTPDSLTVAAAVEQVRGWLDGYDRSDRSENGPRNGVVASRWTDDTPDLTVEALRTLLTERK